MLIRRAKTSDLPAAAQLWLDRIALLQQSDPQVRLLPEARARWSEAARGWIADESVAAFVGEKAGSLVGFAVVGIVAGKPGLHPPRRGTLIEMTLDLHATHPGLSDQLLAEAKSWLTAQGATQLEVEAPARCPVEAAFWRGRGAAIIAETLRLPL